MFFNHGFFNLLFASLSFPLPLPLPSAKTRQRGILHLVTASHRLGGTYAFLFLPLGFVHVVLWGAPLAIHDPRAQCSRATAPDAAGRRFLTEKIGKLVLMVKAC
jgi:hypothetical protein